LFEDTKYETQQFGDRLHVCPEVRWFDGSTYTAGPTGKAVHLWLIGYSSEPSLSECRNTVRKVFNFCICKNWIMGKVQELGGAECNVMWSEV